MTKHLLSAAVLVATIATAAHAQANDEWYRATRCPSYDTAATRHAPVKVDLYTPNSGMISSDSAKAIAVCAIPGQVGAGKMNTDNGIVEYVIDVIPNKKKTVTKVVVDAYSGAVLSSKQLGGLRGAAGWVRASVEHKVKKTP
jgi:uncharacterized membrane protein YkoI